MACCETSWHSGWVASCRRSTLMCLGRPAREIRMGCSRRCRRLSRLGKAMQRAKGGQAASCPPAPSRAQPPLSLCFPARCVVGQKKGLKVKPSPSDRISLPPAPQGTRVPSHACGLVAPFLLEARAAIVRIAHEGNHSRGGSHWKMRTSLVVCWPYSLYITPPLPEQGQMPEAQLSEATRLPPC